jgi:tartrate dehydratase alpha subunit/fumarate hydratase class I-like protein
MRCSISAIITRWITSSALGEAYKAEQGPAAKDAIAQILTNSRMCAEGHRPICQDTGIVNVFVEWGRIAASNRHLALDAGVVDEGVRRAYLHPENKLRASMLPIPPSPAEHQGQHALRSPCRDGAGQTR